MEALLSLGMPLLCGAGLGVAVLGGLVMYPGEPTEDYEVRLTKLKREEALRELGVDVDGESAALGATSDASGPSSEAMMIPPARPSNAQLRRRRRKQQQKLELEEHTGVVEDDSEEGEDGKDDIQEAKPEELDALMTLDGVDAGDSDGDEIPPEYRKLSEAVFGTSDEAELKRMFKEAKQQAIDEVRAGKLPDTTNARDQIRGWFRCLDVLIILALVGFLLYGLRQDYGFDFLLVLEKYFPREAAVFRRVANDLA